MFWALLLAYQNLQHKYPSKVAVHYSSQTEILNSLRNKTIETLKIFVKINEIKPLEVLYQL